MIANKYRHQPATLRAPGSLPEMGGDNEHQSASEQHHNQPQGKGLVAYRKYNYFIIVKIFDPNK